MAVIDETGEYLCDRCRLRVYHEISRNPNLTAHGTVLPIQVAQEWWHGCEDYDGPVEFCNHCEMERL